MISGLSVTISLKSTDLGSSMKNQRVIISKKQLQRFSKTVLFYNVVLVGIPFLVIWGAKTFSKVTSLVNLLLDDGVLSYLWTFLELYIWIIFALLAGIILHELLHALTFMLVTQNSHKTIEFGYIEKPFIPYVHFTEPISVRFYRIALVMPGLLLGIIPSIVGIWQGWIYFALFGIVFTCSAAGDFLVLKATLGMNTRFKIRDLPEQIGFEIIP